MSLAALLVVAAITSGQPPALPTLSEAADDRTPMRCRPAPYYVAEQAGGRTRAQRLMVTGSRVPLVARDYGQRRSRPCFLMRDDTQPNPFRSADQRPDPRQGSGGPSSSSASSLWPNWDTDFGMAAPRRTAD